MSWQAGVIGALLVICLLAGILWIEVLSYRLLKLISASQLRPSKGQLPASEAEPAARFENRESSMESLDQGDGRATTERQADPMAQPPKGHHDKLTGLALPPSHQADVARIIQEAGLNPSDFTWAVQPSRYALIGPLVSALIHAPTGRFFRFEFTEDASGQNRVSVFTIGESAHEVKKAAGSWEDQLGQLRTWLKYLQRHE